MLRSNKLRFIAVLLVALAACSKDRHPGSSPAADGGAGHEAPPAELPDAAMVSEADAASAMDAASPGVEPDAGSAGSGGSTLAGAGGSALAGSSGGGAGGATAMTVELELTEIATTGLAAPSALAFNPYVPDELWVVNHRDSSVVIVKNASRSDRSSQRRLDPQGDVHFMPWPMALAFGGRETSIVDAEGKPVEGTFATCPENTDNFMGPSLWTSDLRIFGIDKAERQAPFNGPDTGLQGPGTHLDMLHRTPACTGIAWEGPGNVYWTYSGTRAMFVKYDFAKDHGIGNDNHADGSVWRYPVSGIGYVEHVPSHLAYDGAHARLYLADTGNGRVVTFEPSSATGSAGMSQDDNVDSLVVALDMLGTQVKELVPSSYGLKKPSGIVIHEQHLYVSDNETSTLHKLTLDGAALASWLVPGVKPGALAGIGFGPDGKLYLVDMVDNRVLRVDDEL